jgi:hypothetical protein
VDVRIHRVSQSFIISPCILDIPVINQTGTVFYRPPHLPSHQEPFICSTLLSDGHPRHIYPSGPRPPPGYYYINMQDPSLASIAPLIATSQNHRDSIQQDLLRHNHIPSFQTHARQQHNSKSQMYVHLHPAELSASYSSNNRQPLQNGPDESITASETSHSTPVLDHHASLDTADKLEGVMHKRIDTATRTIESNTPRPTVDGSHPLPGNVTMAPAVPQSNTYSKKKEENPLNTCKRSRLEYNREACRKTRRKKAEAKERMKQLVASLEKELAGVRDVVGNREEERRQISEAFEQEKLLFRRR